MDIWRMGSGKTSASHAVACLSPCILQACQSALGMGLAPQGNSSGLHIQSCHMTLQRGLTWPAPAQLCCELSSICAGRAGPLGCCQKSQELVINRTAFGLINEFQGLFILLDCFICFHLFLAQTFCPVLPTPSLRWWTSRSKRWWCSLSLTLGRVLLLCVYHKSTFVFLPAMPSGKQNTVLNPKIY